MVSDGSSDCKNVSVSFFFFLSTQLLFSGLARLAFATGNTISEKGRVKQWIGCCCCCCCTPSPPPCSTPINPQHTPTLRQRHRSRPLPPRLLRLHSNPMPLYHVISSPPWPSRAHSPPPSPCRRSTASRAPCLRSCAPSCCTCIVVVVVVVVVISIAQNRTNVGKVLIDPNR